MANVLNARQMQVEFERSVMLIDQGMEIKEKLDTENIFYFINLAQERYVKNKFLFNGIDEESLQKRYDDVRKIIVRKEVQAVDSANTDIVDYNRSIDFVREITLPDDYLFYIRSDSKVTRDFLYSEGGQSYWVPNKPITHKEVERIMTTPFNKPILRFPLVLFEGDKTMYVYYDQHTNIESVNITYVRYPKLITPETLDVDGNGAPTKPCCPEDANALYSSNKYTNECELAGHTHEEIVDLAVRIFIEEIKYKVRSLADNTAKSREQTM